MDFLRHRGFLRFLSSLVTLSLGVVVVSPGARADGSRTPYADWLRLHIPDAGHPNVQRAIELAAEHGDRTFDDFLDSFSDELDALLASDPAPEGVQADGSSSEKKPTQQKLQQLRIEYTRLVGEALGPQVMELTVPVKHTSARELSVFSTDTGVSGSNPARPSPASQAPTSLRIAEDSPVGRHSGIQPLGP